MKKLKTLTLSLLMACMVVSAASGEECTDDIGVMDMPSSFGSTEQLKYLKVQVRLGCDLIGIKF